MPKPTMVRNCRFAQLLALMLGAGVAVSAQALPTVNMATRVQAGADVGVPDFANTRETSSNQLGRIADSLSTGSTNAQHGWAATGIVEAWSDVSLGAVKAFAVASGTVMAPPGAYLPSGQGYANGSAHASFLDSLQLNVPGAVAGTAYFVSLRLKLDGYASGDGGLVDTAPPGSFFHGTGSWRVGASMASNNYLFNQEWRGSCSSNGGCSGSLPPGWITLDVVLYTQQNYVLQLWADASVNAGARVQGNGHAHGEAIANLGHTVGWGGVISVQTFQGDAVGEFSLLGTSSGIDYSQPAAALVPEPQTLLLFGAGLLMLFGRHRLSTRSLAA